MRCTGIYHALATDPSLDGTPFMETSYRQQTAAAIIDKGRLAPYSTMIPGDMQPDPAVGGRKLLDRFRDKMRSMHYALATEKAYRHWIVEFLRFHRDGDHWKHPATLGKPEIEAFLTHLATQRRVSARRSGTSAAVSATRRGRGTVIIFTRACSSVQSSGRSRRLA